jgi:hypothetical protein
MKKIKALMINHPVASCVLIFPFVFIATFALFSLFFEIILPFIFSIWLTGFIYSLITQSGTNRSNNINIWRFRNFN